MKEQDDLGRKTLENLNSSRRRNVIRPESQSRGASKKKSGGKNSKSKGGFFSVLKKLILTLVLGFFVSSIGMTFVYKWVPVYITPYMLVDWLGNDETLPLRHEWVSLSEISSNLPLAVMASEDQLFMDHNGFDLKQINKAITAHLEKGKKLRGGSTISQQTAKNVFLWNGRSWFRKGLETYFTFLIEKIWGKERIMEVYLNSIEMGRCVYGAQAASQYFYGKDAAQLTKGQSALIASVLPNPKERDLAHPSAYMNKRKKAILHQMNCIKNPHLGAESKK